MAYRAFFLSTVPPDGERRALMAQRSFDFLDEWTGSIEEQLPAFRREGSSVVNQVLSPGPDFRPIMRVTMVNQKLTPSVAGSL